MNIKIKTYIKIPNVPLTNDFLTHTEDFFVDIDDTKRLKGIANIIDLDYIDGAIIIDYHGKQILNYELWDLVDATWAYLMNTIEEMLEKGKSYMSLPDQPIEIEMEEKGREYIRLVIGKGEFGTHLLPRGELLNSLVSGAEHFFFIVKNVLGTEKFDYHIEQIIKIKGKF